MYLQTQKVRHMPVSQATRTLVPIIKRRITRLLIFQYRMAKHQKKHSMTTWMKQQTSRLTYFTSTTCWTRMVRNHESQILRLAVTRAEVIDAQRTDDFCQTALARQSEIKDSKFLKMKERFLNGGTPITRNIRRLW